MVEQSEPAWLVLDGYEDEPAAFGVPPYVGFHIRYLCGVLEQAKVPYEYTTIDAWRMYLKEAGEEAVLLDGAAAALAVAEALRLAELEELADDVVEALVEVGLEAEGAKLAFAFVVDHFLVR